MKNISVAEAARRRLLIVAIALLALSSFVLQQDRTMPNSMQIVFYNVENLFDTENDPDTDDDEFTPKGIRNWSITRYNKKINLISQAILSITNYNLPEIIALSEIENREVMCDLMNNTILKNGSYLIIHKDSPDKRGIDVGMIYDSIKIKPIKIEYIPVNLADKTPTRDILYVKALCSGDSVHLFVNHWPSRFSGARNSAEKRMEAARTLLSKCDSIFNKNEKANIILMGDFNDEATDASMALINEFHTGALREKKYINLMESQPKNSGTLKYQGLWYCFDQFIISRSMIKPENKLWVENGARIADQEFLFIKDKRYMGKRPFRTYNGYRYEGGFSDHLPVMLKVRSRE